MSYGWLTQSAFLPTKKKQIDVDNDKSLIDMKINLIKEKEKIYKKIKPDQVYTSKSILKFKNPNNSKIEINKEKSNVVVEEELNCNYEEIKQNLIKKEKIYDKLMCNSKFEDEELIFIKENSSINFSKNKRKDEISADKEIVNTSNNNLSKIDDQFEFLKKKKMLERVEKLEKIKKLNIN